LRQIEAKVLSNEIITNGLERSGGRSIESTHLITVDCPETAAEARPGQFIMVNCDNTLPRPFSIHRVTGDGRLSVYFSVPENGQGTDWLSQRKEGDTLKILGPLGNGFMVERTSHNILLVAGGMGIAPLVFLAEEAVRTGVQVSLLYGTQDRGRLPIEKELTGVSVVAATEDGSEGYHGLVTDLIPRYIDAADQVFVCGPLAMYRSMSGNRESLFKNRPVQVSLEVRMACGRGVCYGCTILTRTGTKRVCEDGPLFNFDDILLEDLR
jgi:dihydroorotate dehydrogenase electron transfer subunit